jgi:membrane protease YdiL (CAAX protease family)
LAARGLYLAAAAFFLYLAALAEEMLFRGWALQQTGAFTRRLPLLLLINGVLFSLAHFDPDMAAFLSRAIMGMAWTWIVLRLGGVELAAGAHLANNLAICLFVRPVLFTPPPKEPFDVASVALEAATVAILVIAVEAALRRWPSLAAGRPQTS